MTNLLKFPDREFRSGDYVHIGNALYTFRVKAIGFCGPNEHMVNSSEFLQILIPGTADAIFNIHRRYVTLATFEDGA